MEAYTMTDLLEKYFSDKSNTSNRSDYKELNVFFNTFFESSSTHDLNLFTTQEFIDTLSKMNILSCVTFETYKSRIKSFFEWCFKNEYCTKTQIDNFSSCVVTFGKIFPVLNFNFLICIRKIMTGWFQILKIAN